MKTPCFFLVFLCLIGSCGRKISKTSSVSSLLVFKLRDLRADNISEEITGNDEIHIIYWLLKDSIPIPSIKKRGQDFHVFYKDSLFIFAKLHFTDTIPFAEKNAIRLLVLIVEADEESSFSEQEKKIDSILQKGHYYPDQQLKIELEKNLKDDDVLSLSIYSLTDLQNNPNQQIYIRGMHMLDRYFYRLGYTIEEKATPH